MVAKRKGPATPFLVRADLWRQAKPEMIIRLEDYRRTRPPKPVAELMAECRASFAAFLPYWKFKVRDNTGRNAPILTFENLWAGQKAFVDVMDDRTPEMPWGPWIFALKAGKLGFSELECAFDAYSAIFREPNARVHIFSRDLEAAKEMLKIVRYGITNLPPWFGIRLLRKAEAGADTTTQLKFRFGPDDERTIRSYATGENISIDQSAQHVHLDELANHKKGKAVWEGVQTTVAQNGGTLHVVTRGNGEDAFIQNLWKAASEGSNELRAFFTPWQARDDRDQRWYETQSNNNTLVGLSHFAPETPEDALAGDAENDFLDIFTWDRCYDPGMPRLQPSMSEMPMVLALDAAISGDSFAAVGSTRHPEHGLWGLCASTGCGYIQPMDSEEPFECPRCSGTVMPVHCQRTHSDPAIRAVKIWTPEQFASKRINFITVEGWLRALCQGGCPGGGGVEAHPLYTRGAQSYRDEWSRNPDRCDACRAGLVVPAHNVIKVTYDMYQLEDMMQRFREDGVATVGKFDQGTDRLVADSGLRSMAVQHRLAHNGDQNIRENVKNANAKLQANEDSKVRIVKKDEKRRIDGLVAASMSTDEALRLYI